jgi:hypothetical protein
MPANNARDIIDSLVPTYLFSSSRIDRELVSDFFMLFARAEYALKKAEWLHSGNNGQIIVEWEEFAKTLGDKLTDPQDARIWESVRFLQQNAPCKLVCNGHKLRWEERKCTDSKDPKFVIRSVTTVRNNLFHGGKEIVGLMTERDRGLIESSLIVLAYCISLNERVANAFSELGPGGAVA